jgi:hypothetical protein
MIFQSGEGEGVGEGRTNPEPLRVGYRNPPAEHRFKKGQSGNPRGRPRKARSGGMDSPDYGTQFANKCLIEEAYRPVLVREGEKIIKLPAIQAVFRAMGVSAMKGNRFAQLMLANLVQTVEAQGQQARDDSLKTAIDYKCTWEEWIEEARNLGQPDPQPIPHPDDVFIDFIKGEAKVCGPLTREAKEEWDRALGHLDRLQAEISELAETFRRTRSKANKAHVLDRWKFEQKLFDQLNDDLPKRYRRWLEDRCWEEGATLPGEQRKVHWPNED